MARDGVAIILQCVYAVLWISFREALCCESRDVQEIVKDLDLEEVEDWETLASWLSVSAQPIRENCILTTTAVAQCHRRMFVATYCDLIGGDAQRVKADIRHVLDSEMRIKKQGDYNEKYTTKHELYHFLLILLTCVLATAVILAVKYHLTGERPAVMTTIAESVAQKILILLPITFFPVFRYAMFLRAVYSTYSVYESDKFPPTPSKVFIKLALVKNVKASQAQANKFIHLTLRGDTDQILKVKEPIEMDEILKEDDEIRLVVVEGVPGIGKSTLAWELCRQWPTLESLKRFSLVVFLRLQEERVQSAKDISDLFLCGDNPDLSSLVAQEVKEDNGNGVLFVFDGFYEFPSELQENSLVMDIIRGSKFLPKATVLVTSRPSASAQLQVLLQTGIDKQIEVVGFSEKEIFEFARSVLGDTNPFAHFNTYLAANPVLKGMMYNPLNCAIVVGVYQDTYEAGKPVPHTQTQLYTELTLCLLSRYMSATRNPLARKLPEKLEDLPHDSNLYQQLVKVGKLAFEAKLRDQVIFKELPEGCSDLGLLVKHTALYTRKEATTYNFFHLTLQEYMSAFYITQLPADEQRTLFSEHSTSIDLVWRFVAGLTKMQNIGWDEVKKMTTVKRDDVPTNVVAVDPFLLRCLYEAHDVESCESVFDQQRLRHRYHGHDHYALGYCISMCSNTWDVDMQGITREGLELLGHGMKSVDYGGGSIGELDLSSSKGIINEGGHLLQMPHQILQFITVLGLGECDIEQRGFENLAKCIPYLNSLIALDISRNPGGDGSLVNLLQALKKHGKLQKLSMTHIQIGMNDITAIADVVQSASSLRELVVGGFHSPVTSTLSLLTADVAKQLVKTVLSPSSLKTVFIMGFEYPLDGIQTISDSISTLMFDFEIQLLLSASDRYNIDLSVFDDIFQLYTPTHRLTANPSRVKGGTKLSQILRENTSLKELSLNIPLDKDELDDIIDSLKDNHSLESLQLSKMFHSHYYSESEQQALDPLVNFEASCIIL